MGDKTRNQTTRETPKNRRAMLFTHEYVVARRKDHETIQSCSFPLPEHTYG